MTRVLLIHADPIPHYRIPVYGYLSAYLKNYGFELFVASDGIQPDNPHKLEFKFIEMSLSTLGIFRQIRKLKIEIIIDFMSLRHKYLFPTYFLAKSLLRKKFIYWGQGCDLLDSSSYAKNFLYSVELGWADAILLYAQHLMKYVPKRLHKKTFIANNTLCLSHPGIASNIARKDVLSAFDIHTAKNIICMGRIQKRKKVDHLINAFEMMERDDIGLIIVGPDPDGILNSIPHRNIYRLGPIYDDRRYDLLLSSDVYCLPGAVGLGIVDAFYCGLPIITEEGDESAEIMYLKNGLNGFVVPNGDIREMSSKLMFLLDNDTIRADFSRAAKKEIVENGSMDTMCSGFVQALSFAVGRQYP